jgi:hypothetical protein
MAFTDFGIDSLVELIEMHKADPTLLKRQKPQTPTPAAYAGWLLFRFPEPALSLKNHIKLKLFFSDVIELKND